MSQPRILRVSIDDQTLEVIEDGKSIRRFTISTATKGMGFTVNSYRTPTGSFRISEKIGDGEPAETIFKKRLPVGQWDPGNPDAGDLVLSRILRLDGLDGENANTFERFIYIHGTNHEDKLGSPASQGCVRLSCPEMVELYDMVTVGDEVEILPATRQRGKLFFFDCDSTLSSIEGIDELGRGMGSEIFTRVETLTNAAMNGEVPINEVFFRRMDMIRPDRQLCDIVARKYIDTIVPGVREFIGILKKDGWLPIILSGGFAPLIQPLADELGIAHVEAVPLYLNDDGSYCGYGEDYPTTCNLGKNEVIREWKKAMLPERVIMMGDGISDMETKPDVDLFIGYGGVIARPRVMEGADYWLTDMEDISGLMDAITTMESASNTA